MKKLLVLLSSPLLASCLIAESPADFPEQPTERPTIVQSRVIPSASQVLGSWPAQGGFLVPVKLLNPTQVFEWRVFVDFDADSLTSENRPAKGDTSRPTDNDVNPDDARRGIRRIQFLLDPPDESVCHRIEFVATSESFGAAGANNVDPLKSDQITWIYSPNGDLSGCPVQAAPIPPYEDPALEEAAGAD